MRILLISALLVAAADVRRMLQNFEQSLFAFIKITRNGIGIGTLFKAGIAIRPHSAVQWI